MYLRKITINPFLVLAFIIALPSVACAWWFSQAETITAPPLTSAPINISTLQSENDIHAISTNLPMQKSVTMQESDSRQKDKKKPSAPTFINEYCLGFTSLEKEIELKDMRILGELPAWLHGSLILIGPGKFEINDSKAGHWFDGFAMLHRFSFKAGHASYANKFIDSEYLQESRSNGKMSTAAAAADPNASFFSKLSNALSNTSRPHYDNTNINITAIGSCCAALTESALALMYDPHTLKTKDYLAYNDTFDPHMSCAHPQYDAQANEYYGLATTFGNTSSYSVYKVNQKTMERTVLTTITSSLPSYMHSFSITKQFIILTEVPFVVNPYDLIMSGKPFIENFQWKAKQKTRIHIIDRMNGSLLSTVQTDPFFVFHHINAWDNQDTITLDCAVYDDAAIVPAFFLNPIFNVKNHIFPQAYLTQITITFEDGNKRKPLADVKKISTNSLEMPRINAAFHMKQNTYVYGVSSEKNTSYFNQLIKIDKKTGTETIWKEDHCYFTEPIFVAEPRAAQEDAGVLLSLVLQAQQGHSFLLVLDASTMQERARINFEHHIPFTSHGAYYPRSNAGTNHIAAQQKNK